MAVVAISSQVAFRPKLESIRKAFVMRSRASAFSYPVAFITALVASSMSFDAPGGVVPFDDDAGETAGGASQSVRGGRGLITIVTDGTEAYSFSSSPRTRSIVSPRGLK